MRWKLIKDAFSRRRPKRERITSSWAGKRERGIWQRRFWEHVIRDDDDLQRHVDYAHYNPVKHGHVETDKKSQIRLIIVSITLVVVRL